MNLETQLRDLGLINEKLIKDLVETPYYNKFDTVDPTNPPVRYELNLEAFKNEKLVIKLNSITNYSPTQLELAKIYIPVVTTPTTRLILSNVEIQKQASELVKKC